MNTNPMFLDDPVSAHYYYCFFDNVITTIVIIESYQLLS